ncbi:MAG: hypothetical protein Q9220_001777 [cf. Caloplaca sp. 1 TL-2023]
MAKSSAFLLFMLLIITNTVFSSPLSTDPTPSLTDPSTGADLERTASLLASLPLNNNNATVADAKSRCFTPLPMLKQISRPDCYQLLFQILTQPDAAVPYRWDPRRMALPRFYTWQTCLIALSPVTATSVDTFTELGVARVAALIISDCVTAPKSWIGGRQTIGPLADFWVSVGAPLLGGARNDSQSQE